MSLRHANQRRVLSIANRFLVVALLGLSGAYGWAGFSRLIIDTPGSYPIDLRLRWIEHRLLLDGVNPQLSGHPDPELPESHAPMRDQGGSYPPWAYTIGLLFAPPWPFPVVRWHFALLAAVALAVLGVWGHRQSGWLGTWGSLAIFAGAICISYGQYAILIAALLVGAMWLMEVRRPLVAGVLIGLAMVKPQLCLLFLLMVLLHGQYLAVVSAIVTVAGASLVASWMARTTPWSMLVNVSGEASLYYWLSHNPLLPWLVPYVGFETAVVTLGIGGIAVTVGLWMLQGARPALVHSFAVAAVVTMFWSYRRHYDTIVMVLALAPLLRLMGSNWWNSTLVLLVGLSLWAPVRHTQWEWPAVQFSHLLLWPTAVVMIIVQDRSVSPPSAQSASAQ